MKFAHLLSPNSQENGFLCGFSLICLESGNALKLVLERIRQEEDLIAHFSFP